MDSKLGRREVLLGAGAATGGLLATGVGLAVPAAADDKHHGGHDDKGLYGSWYVHREDDTDPADKAVLIASFAAGHVIISHQILPESPVETGTWASHDHRFRATFYTGFPGEGGPGTAGGTVKIKIRGRRHGDTISGRYFATAYDPTGAEIPGGSTTGTFEGERIDA
jgi:hypothetical protein